MSDQMKYGISEKTQILSGNALKVIAVITMLIDHAAWVLLDPYIKTLAGTQYQYEKLRTLYTVMRAIGRTAFPIFCFLLIEGFHYTHSRRKYLRNIILFAFVSEYPFDLAMSGKFHMGYQNVMFTMAIGLAVIWGIESAGKSIQKRIVRQGVQGDKDNTSDTIRKSESCGAASDDMRNSESLRRAASVRDIDLDPDMIVSYEKNKTKERHHTIAEEHSGYGPVWAGFLQIMAGMGFMIAGMLVSNLLKTDYSMIGIVLICVLYLLKDERLYAGAAGYAIMCWEPWSFPAFILMQFYNGKRGRGWKYFFYAFYPAHLLILYFIRHFCLRL